MAGVEQLTNKGRVSAAVKGDRAGGIAGIRIDRHRRSSGQQLGEIPARFTLIRDCCSLRQALAQAEPFVVAEEKCLVLTNWAAESSAELVLLVLGFGHAVDEKLSSIQGVIAEILEDVPVVAIGSGFDDGVQDGAVSPAKFRAVIVGLDLEFLDRVDRWLDDVRRLVE